MKWLSTVVNALDKVKVIIKIVRAIDAAIDAAKAVLEDNEKRKDSEKES